MADERSREAEAPRTFYYLLLAGFLLVHGSIVPVPAAAADSDKRRVQRDPHMSLSFLRAGRWRVAHVLDRVEPFHCWRVDKDK